MKRITFGGVLLLAMIFLIRCGSSSSSSNATSVIPLVGIASPMAATTARTEILRGEDATSTGTVKPLSEAKSDLQKVIDKTTAAGCFEGLGFKSFSKNVACYGPQLVIQNHPDGNFTFQPDPPPPAPPTNKNCPTGVDPGSVGTNDGCLPGGDLGIWTATEGGTEACAAAKSNELVGDVAETVNSAMKFMAAMACVAKVNGKSLPAVGASVDLLTDVKTALPLATVTTASITRNADYSGTTDPVYTIVLTGTIGSKSMSVTLKNSFNTTNKTFRGRISGYHSASRGRPGGIAGVRGFSALFEQASATDLRVVTKMGITSTSAGTTTLFDTNGDYDFANFLSGTGGNGRYLIANLDPSTGMGTVKFGWQAGTGDSHTRVFQGTASRSGTTDTGFAYFGFGPQLSSTFTGSISGMICNWAGPNNNHTTSITNFAGLAQGQSFSRTAATSQMTAVTNQILFSPTNSCVNAPIVGFLWGTLSEWGATGAGVTEKTVSPHQLGSTTSLGTIPTTNLPVFAP